jgi:hypothetical protein
MKKLILILLILISCGALCSYARSDCIDSFVDWDLYYHQFKIKGFPVYNALLERYDFFDLDDNYRGSLSFNPLLDRWEYFGL